MHANDIITTYRTVSDLHEKSVSVKITGSCKESRRGMGGGSVVTTNPIDWSSTVVKEARFF